MPEKDIARLQSDQNWVAKVVATAPRFSRSVPILKRLNWLPVKFRIHLNILLTDLFGRNAQNINTLHKFKYIFCSSYKKQDCVSKALSISGPALSNCVHT